MISSIFLFVPGRTLLARPGRSRVKIYLIDIRMLFIVKLYRD